MEQTPETGQVEPDERAAPTETTAPSKPTPPPPVTTTPVARPRGSRRGALVAIVLIALLLVAFIGYAVAGTVYATSRISNADRALNAVVSHQNQLNTTFKSINSQWGTLQSGSSFNVTQAQSLNDQFVASSEAAVKTIDHDDASLAAASGGLNDQQWLTTFSRGSLDHEASRISHARKALRNARTVAADYVIDGHFSQALYKALADLDQLTTQNATGDIAGAKTTVPTMKTHIDSALELSSAPGFPPEVHSLMVDFQTLTVDFGKLLDADTTGDDTAIVKTEQVIQNDLTKIAGYDFDKIGSAIDAFYKPFVDGFNSEMAAATA